MSNNRDYQIDVLGYEPRERLFMSADYIGSEETALDGAHDEARQFAYALPGDWDMKAVWTNHNDGRGSRPDGYRVEWAEPRTPETLPYGHGGPDPIARLRGDEGRA